MSFVALATSALGLGFLHGLGADHLMAIAAMTVTGRADGRGAGVVRTALGFAFGHALVLATGAALALAFGLALPAAVESGAERLGGVLLIVLGALGLWTIASGRAYGHVHRESDGRRRWHLHLGLPVRHPPHGHAHSPVPAVMGGVFAVSSLRALTLLEPFGPGALTLAVPAILLLVALFGLGILVSMSLFGVLLARLLSLGVVERIGQAAGASVAIASIGLGTWWTIRDLVIS
jgi:hypothetical protein